MPRIVLLGTCDSKLDELLYLRAQILQSGGNGCEVIFVDVGRSPVEHEAITVSQETLTSTFAPEKTQDVSKLPRAEVIRYMAACATKWMQEAYQKGLDDTSQTIHGAISAGGTGGTSLASSIMREALPIGLPKLIVSTNASGDTGPVVGECDITMMYSVVDIAGSNKLLRRILSNAGGAIAGMALAYDQSLKENADSQSDEQKKRVGLTMFGVTTPCVDMVREYLETNYAIECFVFHCTGHGGKALERLVKAGSLDAVLDITTTEICDHICGGVMDAGPHRLEAALQAGIPYVISVGATDMVNFGPKATVPEKYQHRRLYEHNPAVTLMRTSPEECARVGDFIVDKVKRYTANSSLVEVVLPLGGVSMIATPGGPFHDAEADKALISMIECGLQGTGIRVDSDHKAINDKEFALSLARKLTRLMGV